MTTKLQDELRQRKPFVSLGEEALLSVLRTAAVLDHELGEALKPKGITWTQYNVLRILRDAGEGGLCGREIGARLISQVPDVSRLLDRMEELGLVSRERAANDRRHVTARITRDGLDLLGEVDSALGQVVNHRFGQFAGDELRMLIASLGLVREGR
jgi:DNA-binding MarR family transcriptional regulator